MLVSVVVPTFNRGERLLPTLHRLLVNETPGIRAIEIVVVDNGSAIPAAPLLANTPVRVPYSLSCTRLETNVGPSGARNAGFRATSGDIVIFVDDDILAPPDLIWKHVEAHSRQPGSVIFGSWRLVTPDPITPLFRYITSLGLDGGRIDPPEFVPCDVVASGHLSVERRMFRAEDGVYRDDLSAPAAEEYELALRLRQRGIPILLATRILALHDHEVTLSSMCRQQFKHAMGCGAAATKYPETLTLRDVKNIIVRNQPSMPGDTLRTACRKRARELLSRGPVLRGLLLVARIAEHLVPRERLLAPLYRVVLGLHFAAGVREGLRRFSGRD